MSDDSQRQRIVVALALLTLAASIYGLVRLSRHQRPAPAAAAPSSKPAPALPPLAAESWLTELEVPGFGSSYVAVPIGAREPRPIVIALHGGADRPEWACGTWTGITKARAFVLCPRGVETSGSGGALRYGWGSQAEVERELRGALKALKARFAEHVASGPVTLVAFAAGVKYALELARTEPPFFARILVVGSEPDTWSAGRAAVYARAGGKRLLFAVSDPASRASSSTYWVFARGAGLETKLSDLGDLGLVLDAAVARALTPQFEWLVSDDPRYPKSPG